MLVLYFATTCGVYCVWAVIVPQSFGCISALREENMILKLFGPSKTDEFAKNLAQDIAKRYPPAIANNPEQMVSQKRLTAILEDAFNKARQFNADNQLGMFKKAKLGNTFKWELKELGYESKFVDMATEGLIVYLTRK
jgi:hypothetical protein